MTRRIRTVVKLGGSLLEDPDRRAKALSALAALWSRGERLVVVHGGGRRVDAWLDRLGLPRRVHQGLRVTDAATLDVVVGVLAGQVNKALVAELSAAGVRAAGLCGADGGTLVAEPHPPIAGQDLGHVGRIVSVDGALVELIACGPSPWLPVVASIALSLDGAMLNVNADAAASALAIGLGAERLFFLTDVAGLLDGSGRLVRRLSPDRAARMLDSTAVAGGMKPKLQACVEAISRGVREVVIAGPAVQARALTAGKGGTHLVAA